MSSTLEVLVWKDPSYEDVAVVLERSVLISLWIVRNTVDEGVSVADGVPTIMEELVIVMRSVYVVL